MTAGEWGKDERHGNGRYTYINGDVYEGEWRNGRRHGTGTYKFAATGSHYYGQWKNGRQVGYGELVHSNHKYYGRFKNNQVLALVLISRHHSVQAWCNPSKFYSCSSKQ